MKKFDFGFIFKPDAGFTKNYSVIEVNGRIKNVLPTSMANELYIGIETISLCDYIALPGFVDAHSHFPDIGLFECCWTNISSDNNPATSVAEIIYRLKKSTAKMSFKGWIVGYGVFKEDMKEGRFPTRRELDDVSVSKPVVIFDRTFHQAATKCS